MITLALLLALLSPDRAGNAPLVHVVGWNRVIDGTGAVVVDWEYDGAEHDVAFTLQPGEQVEVRWLGSCTLGGVTHRAGLIRHAVCATTPNNNINI